MEQCHEMIRFAHKEAYAGCLWEEEDEEKETKGERPGRR